MGARRVYTSHEQTHVRFAGPSVTFQRGDKFEVEYSGAQFWVISGEYKFLVKELTYARVIERSKATP